MTMEVRRSSEDVSTLSLRWNGDVLSPEGSMTCLILASCRCDQVPALIFTRPYLPRRRWNKHGEIDLADPPSADMIPQWPLKMITDATWSSMRGRDRLGEGSCERFINWRLSPSIETLCEQSVISIERDGEENLSFEMTSSMREEIWKQTSTEDRLLIWFDLLQLVIHSSPDAYAEIFWRAIFHKNKAVIDSTILPFLSVLEWNHLMRRQVLIPRLLSFLLHYSIYNGFSVDTCLHLAPTLLESIKSFSNLTMNSTIEILEFKEDLCFHLLHPHKKRRKSSDRPLSDLLETADLHGVLGFLLASISQSSQASRDSNEIITIAHSWRERQGRAPSTMLAFAEHLLFASEPMDQNLKHSYTLGNADIHVRCTIAIAMVEHNRFTEAYAFLAACAKDFRSTDPVHVDGYFPVMTELVKCCNVLNREDQGEATALEVLRHRYSDTATRKEICSMRIALADSLIGQSKYSEAEKLLEDVLAVETFSDYLTAAATLRLSKVKRRIGTLDVYAFTLGGARLKALVCASDSNSHMRDECLEELSSTVSFAQQNFMDNLPEVKAVLDTASTIPARQAISTSNWRPRVLQKQVAHVSELQKRVGQYDHRDIAGKSVYAQGSQKIPPLRVLVLREYKYWRGLSLDNLHRAWNAGDGHDIVLTSMPTPKRIHGTLDLSFKLVILQLGQSVSKVVASVLSEQGFTGSDNPDWLKGAGWVVFYRSMYLCIPNRFESWTSLNEIKQYLIMQRQGQDRNFRPFMLQRLGDTGLNSKIGRSNDARGISQEGNPTDKIFPSSDLDSIVSNLGVAHLQTSGHIMFPNPQSADMSTYEGLSASKIMLGRFIEDVDRPSETYYPSKVASYLEETPWGQASIRTRTIRDSSKYYPKTSGLWHYRVYVGTETIRTYRSLLSIENRLPDFLGPSEKRDLTEWVSQRKAGKAAFLITAYQTYMNATLKETKRLKSPRRNRIRQIFRPETWLGEKMDNLNYKEYEGSSIPSRQIYLPGERVAAICVREVKIVQSPNGEADLEYGKEFWRVYWGLVEEDPDL